jgi:hypothetical protein
MLSAARRTPFSAGPFMTVVTIGQTWIALKKLRENKAQTASADGQKNFKHFYKT